MLSPAGTRALKNRVPMLSLPNKWQPLKPIDLAREEIRSQSKAEAVSPCSAHTTIHPTFASSGETRSLDGMPDPLCAAHPLLSTPPVPVPSHKHRSQA